MCLIPNTIIIIMVMFVFFQTWSCVCWTMTLKAASRHSTHCSTISLRRRQMKEPTLVHLHPPLLPWTTPIQPPLLALFLALVKTLVIKPVCSLSFPTQWKWLILKKNDLSWIFTLFIVPIKLLSCGEVQLDLLLVTGKLFWFSLLGPHTITQQDDTSPILPMSVHIIIPLCWFISLFK